MKNPTITVKVKKEVEVTYLYVDAGPRFWCDITLNGERNDDDDWDGEGIPCKNGDRWQPIIYLKTGQIINWKEGNVASTHFKVCDDGMYYLKDEDNNIVAEKEGYVPDILDPYNDGYGDYIILDIDENGFINKFKCDFKGFECEDEDD
jgi:hypothetical protein